MDIPRRKLLVVPAAAAAGYGVWSLARTLAAAPQVQAMQPPKSQYVSRPPLSEIVSKVDAAHWQALDSRKVKCVLCPRECSVADMERGWCGVRENQGGKYYTLVYGRPCAIHIDPVEKKPLFHYLPGSKAYSIGTAGCNIECQFCQNWNISQMRPEQVESFDLPPASVAQEALRADCTSVACTYNEPVIFFEYVRDCAQESRKAGIPTVMISNGYIQKAPMVELCGPLGAVKIDLKSFSEKFYVETCRGTLQPVLDTLKTLKDQGIWFEIVVLLVTGLNDSSDEVKRLANWSVTNLSPDVPLHFSRYFPCYKLQLPQTPVETMNAAFNAATAEGCHFVYVGNIELPGKADTLCPGCRTVAIKRLGMMVVSNNLESGKCPKCGRAIPGVWRQEDAFKRGILS